MLRPAMGSTRRRIVSVALGTLALGVPAAASPAWGAAGTRGAAAGTATASRSAREAGASAHTGPHAGASGPICTPQTLDGSAQLDGAVTVSPMPGAADASPQTQISFLGVPVGELSSVSVVGSRSGAHGGRLEPYSQGDGGSFLPQSPFTPGETVTVTAQLALPGGAQPLRFQFVVADDDPLTTTPARLHDLRSPASQTFVSRPDLLPPVVTVHTHSSLEAPGDLFLAPYGVPAQAGPMILDSAGNLIWFEPLSAPTVATNLRVQQLGGVPVLTWWQGTITHGFGIGADVIVGSHYQTIAEVHAGNGYQADLHEFQITPAGTALLSSYHAIHCNLSAIGGIADGAVTDSLLQEVDIRTGLVMFEWTSVDHVPLTDSYAPASGGSPRYPFDFFHLNSINLDPDGTLLVSSRNTWAVYDVDAQTGQLLWTLGGKQSSFTEGNGAATAYQHDARPVGAGTFSVFDNGAGPQIHAQSRGVVLAVNPQTHAVSVQSQYLHPAHPLLAQSQGDMQGLAGGDWFVGWGQEPDFSEFSAAGSLLFDASLPAGYESYRALSFPWSATPLHPPALVLRRSAGGGPLVAYVSWNGATNVARWEVLEGASAGRLSPASSFARTGFETAIAVPPRAGARFIEVRALDATGATLGSSATVALAQQQA